VSEAINCVLAEEYVPCPDQHFYIYEASHHENGERLHSRLEDVAYFLADLHTRSLQATMVDRLQPIRYLDKLLKSTEVAGYSNRARPGQTSSGESSIQDSPW
jgi:hypothetical protein